MSTQPGSSLVWQARIRHTDRNRVAATVGELLLRVYRRACGLVPLRSARFDPQSLSFRVSPHTPGDGFVPHQVNLYAPNELQSDDRIMWRVCVRPPSDPDGGDQEWPEIGQVCWDLDADTLHCLVLPGGAFAFARREGLRRQIQGTWDRDFFDFFWAGLTDEMAGWVRTDDEVGVIMGDGATRLVRHDGAGPEHIGRIREIVRQYEHFAMLPPRVRAQGLRMLAQGVSRSTQRAIDQFHELMWLHHPMSLDRIEGWVVDRLVFLRHYTADEIREPEARASAIQAAMIRNNIREFDELTRLGLSCLGRARVRNDRATRYGSPVTSRNPCAEIVLPAESSRVEFLAQETLGAAIGNTSALARVDMGDVRIELTTSQGTIETPIQQDPERIRGVRSNTIIIDDSEAGLDPAILRSITGENSSEAEAGGITRESVEEARRLPRRLDEERERLRQDVENTRRAKRQQELRQELARVLSQMFDPNVDDAAMPAADMALVHLRYRLHALLTAAPVGRLQVEVDWNNDQALDALIKDPQNGNVELSRIRMDAPGDFVRNRLPEAEVGVGERAIDL